MKEQFCITDYKNINDAFLHSEKILDRVQGGISSKKSSLNDYICVFLVGSYGRYEATCSSDIEWLTVYDDERVGLHEANIYQASITEIFANILGREKLSINKTFGDILSLSNLATNIGGIADTSRTLTYRMLCLMEGTPLIKNNTYKQIIDILTNAYGRSHTAGHRLLSFASDIARYWRTLRIDYKQKVDEQKKPWAVRGMKLRGYRRYWFFSVIMHFIAFGPRYSEDDRMIHGFNISDIEKFMNGLNNNPTKRILEASTEIGNDIQLINTLIQTYDEYCNIISNAKTRETLDLLKFEDRYDDNNYVDLKKLCIKLHSDMSDIIISLPEFHKKQMIEMFLL